MLDPDVAFVVRVWSSRLMRGTWDILEFWGPWRLRGGAAVDDDADEAVEFTMLLGSGVPRRLEEKGRNCALDVEIDNVVSQLRSLEVRELKR